VLLAVAASDAGARPIRLRNLVLPEKMSDQVSAPKVAGNARISGLQLIQFRAKPTPEGREILQANGTPYVFRVQVQP
jgi:hypothetical protein